MLSWLAFLAAVLHINLLAPLRLPLFATPPNPLSHHPSTSSNYFPRLLVRIISYPPPTYS